MTAVDVDVATVNVDAATVNVDAATVNVDAATVNVDAATVDVDAATVDVDALSGRKKNPRDERAVPVAADHSQSCALWRCIHSRGANAGTEGHSCLELETSFSVHIARELRKTGFHRTAKTALNFSLPLLWPESGQTERASGGRCDGAAAADWSVVEWRVALVELMPASLFVDPFELAQVHRLGGPGTRSQLLSVSL